MADTNAKPRWVSLKTFGAWKPDESRSGSQLDTASFWGGLPEVLSVSNAAALVAHVMRQDAVALQEVIRVAILDGELQGWTLGERPGEWHRTGPRVLQTIHASTVKRTDDGHSMTMEVQLAADQRPVLHMDGTGVRGADLLALLRRRGRPVPAELATALAGPIQDEGAAESEVSSLAAVAPAAADTALAPTASNQPRRVTAHAAQEAAILALLAKRNIKPLAIERAPRGNKRWPLRESLRNELGYSTVVMEKAWRRLRAAGQIRDE